MISDHWFYIVVLLLIALVVFGPRRLPELGNALGKAIREFRQATHSTGEEVGELAGSLNQTLTGPVKTGVVSETYSKEEAPSDH